MDQDGAEDGTGRPRSAATSHRIAAPGASRAVLANVWGAEHPHTTPQFQHWLLGDTPAGAGSGVMMLDSQEVVGFAGLLPRRVEIESDSLLVAQCVDYMVHAQARSRAGSFRIMSIWTHLARDLGFAFGIGFPNASSHKIVTRSKLGWRDAFWPDLMARPLAGAAVPGFLTRWGSARLLRLTGVMAKLAKARAGWSLRQRPRGEAFLIDRFDSRFDLLWQRARAGSLSGIRRDARLPQLAVCAATHLFLFAHRLGVQRRSVGLRDSEPARGFRRALHAPRRPAGGTRCGKPCRRSIIGRSSPSGGGAEYHLLLALAVDGSPTQTALRRGGLITVPRRFNPKPFVMTVHDLGASSNLPAFWADWHFSWGDTNVV